MLSVSNSGIGWPFRYAALGTSPTPHCPGSSSTFGSAPDPAHRGSEAGDLSVLELCRRQRVHDGLHKWLKDFRSVRMQLWLGKQYLAQPSAGHLRAAQGADLRLCRGGASERGDLEDEQPE